jgi:hypothetical protein
MSRSSAKKATQLLKRRPYKITVTHALQPDDLASRVQFCSWFTQSVVKGEIDPQLTFFSDKRGFTCSNMYIRKIIATGVHRIRI